MAVCLLILPNLAFVSCNNILRAQNAYCNVIRSAKEKERVVVLLLTLEKVYIKLAWLEDRSHPGDQVAITESFVQTVCIGVFGEIIPILPSDKELKTYS